MSGRRRGASLLELLVALAVFAALAVLLLERLLWVQEYAEKTRVEVTLRNMQSGLRYAVAELMVNGRDREIPALAGQNPVGWLKVPPEGYLGEVGSQPEEPAPGSWFFDRGRAELVYVVNLDRHFTGDDGRLLRFKAVPAADGGAAGWVRVAAMTGYQWF